MEGKDKTSQSEIEIEREVKEGEPVEMKLDRVGTFC